MSWLPDAVSKWPSLSPCPRCQKLRGSSSRPGRGTATLGRPGSASAVGGRWRPHLSPRGPESSLLSLPRGAWDSHRPCRDLVVHTCPPQNPASNLSPLGLGDISLRLPRGSRRAFLGDLGRSDHHFPEAPRSAGHPRGHQGRHNQPWGLRACVTFRPCGLEGCRCRWFCKLNCCSEVYRATPAKCCLLLLGLQVITLLL